MDRSYYLGLASAGLKMPIGTHLVLHEHADHAQIVKDGPRLGRVVETAARRFKIPLALPLMDLKLEKEALLQARGIPGPQIETYHFQQVPADDFPVALTAGMEAVCGGIHHIATQTDLLPVGMGIGPFSLMTKLISDPITPVFLAGDGATGAEEPEVALVEWLLELATRTIQTYLAAQIQAGAKAIILCEPAANKVYFSPNQLAESYEIFDRYVMQFNQRIREQLRAAGVDLIFHDCGELENGMIERFATLDPAMISLGSSRMLWEDAKLLPKNVVLYGNLPSKQFYSDELCSVAKVRQLSDTLLQKMRATGHPFVLGSECDVLSVPGHEQTIQRKVEEFLKTA
jgi:uroporphyrinogen-III decarboxylase